jgi:hypothetical protein
MSTAVKRSSIEKQDGSDSQVETVQHNAPNSHAGFGSEGPKAGGAVLDYGGDSSLPPPPVLTAAEEHKLYRKLDLRYVCRSGVLYEAHFLLTCAL